MIPQSSSWEDKKQVIKGNFGESIVDDYLESLGFVMYSPKTTGAHAFDRLAIKNKETVVIAECKTKARRNKYYDTGLNYRHYLEYKKISEKHNIPVFLFFIDEMEKRIYGNFISELEKEFESNYNNITKKYPCIEENRSKIIYFPLQVMRNIKDLTESEVEFLKLNSTRNYSYEF